MDKQIEALGLFDFARVLDVGTGTGDFAVQLEQSSFPPKQVTIVALDVVREALKRAKGRIESVDVSSMNLMPMAADISPNNKARLPLLPRSFDAVLASLVVSYIDEPLGFLREVFELLRDNGRVVVSTPRRDADLSRLYSDTLAELSLSRVGELFGRSVAQDIQSIQRQYLNEASRLVSLEEAGRFRFFDSAELVRLLRRAGFRDLRVQSALGDPPQTVIVSGRRRS